MDVKSKIDLKLKDLQNAKFSNKNWNITWNLGLFLENLVLISKPKRILEIGTSNGFSTLFLARALLNEDIDSEIFTIEVNETRFLEAKKNFDEVGLTFVKQLKGEIFDILEGNILSEKFNFVFIDAAHKFYKEVVLMLEEKNLLFENVLIVADNVVSHNMGEFIDFMKERYDTELVELDSGFLVCRRK